MALGPGLWLLLWGVSSVCHSSPAKSCLLCVSGLSALVHGLPMVTMGQMPWGSCIIRDVRAALHIPFSEENNSRVCRVCVLPYYTSSGEINNFQALDSRVTIATNSKYKKIGVSCWSDPWTSGSGPVHGSLPLP